MQHRADHIAVGVQDTEATGIGGVPQDVPPVARLEVGRVDVHIRPVADPRRINDVRRRVLGTHVVVGVAEALNDVAEIGQVRVIEGLEQFSSHQPGQNGVGHPDDEVGREGAGAELVECPLLGVVGGDGGLDAVGLFKPGDHVRVEVVHVVEDLQGPALMSFPGGHGVPDRGERDRLVGPGQFQGCARTAVASAGGEDRRAEYQAPSGHSRATEELAPTDRSAAGGGSRVSVFRPAVLHRWAPSW